MTQPKSETDTRLTEQAVVEFLRDHAGFFRQYPNLLSELSLPHESGGAVSLVERQVAILRERNINMRRRMAELVDTARENDHLFAKTRTLTLALLDCDSLHEFNEVLATSLLLDFAADFVACHTNVTQKQLDHLIGHTGELPTDAFASSDQALCLNLRAEEIETVFPGQASNSTGSVVIVPITDAHGVLGGQDLASSLAIGSRDPDRFHKDMDTLFVHYIGDVCGRVLNRLVAS